MIKECSIVRLLSASTWAGVERKFIGVLIIASVGCQRRITSASETAAKWTQHELHVTPSWTAATTETGISRGHVQQQMNVNVNVDTKSSSGSFQTTVLISDQPFSSKIKNCGLPCCTNELDENFRRQLVASLLSEHVHQSRDCLTHQSELQIKLEDCLHLD